MSVTITDFNRSLMGEQLEFLQLRGVELLTTPRYEPLTRRTSRFFEQCVKWQGEEYLLLLSVRGEAIDDLSRANSALKQSGLKPHAPYTLLKGEYTTLNVMGVVQSYDLAAEKLPEGEPLSTFLNGECTKEVLDSIYSSVDALEREFMRCGVRHNNLKLSNIIIDKGMCLHPIRYVDSTFNHSVSECKAEFQELRENISQAAGVEGAHAPQSPNNQPFSNVVLTNEKVGGEFEGIYVFFRDGLFGYADCDGNVIIKPQFTAAERIVEDRAAVTITVDWAEPPENQKMGVINSQCEWIVEAKYDIAQFHLKHQAIRVKQGDKWGLFDYFGRVIAPVELDYIKEEDIPQVKAKHGAKN